MHQEKYSLTWHTYSDHLRDMMKELMMNEDYSDVTLVTEDKKHIKANVSVLSACSPVFKEIFKRDKYSSKIMYLRGIQFSEIESILQFIYLGEATFYEERMDEFLAVAKSLEIKELCNTKSEMNNQPDNEDQIISNEQFTEQNVESDMKTQQQDSKGVISAKGKFECGECYKLYSGRDSLWQHKQSVHKGVKHACNERSSKLMNFCYFFSK